MTLREKEDALIQRVNGLGDAFDQYSYLILCSAHLPEMQEEDRTEANRVQGCQSNLWIKLEWNRGRLCMAADSEALILKGVLAILWELVSGESAEELAETELRFLQETELGAAFTSARAAGMQAVLNQIRKESAVQCGRTDPVPRPILGPGWG